MPLFPNIEQCQLAIQQFPEDQAQALHGIHQHLIQNRTNQGLIDIEGKVLRLLGGWGAFRGQRARRNEHFLQALVRNEQAVTSLFHVLDLSANNGGLTAILDHHQRIQPLYDSLTSVLLMNEVPARIMTVSKSLLMLTGFTVGFDSRVLLRIRQANPFVLTCPGVWPFCLFLETLRFIASEQDEWERANGPMSGLLQGVPIGQIMDRILWGKN